MFKNFILTLFLVSSYLVQSQQFKHPGKLILQKETITGNFSTKITSRTTVLVFKTATNETFNVFNLDNTGLIYDKSGLTYRTKKINGTIQILETLVEGKATLYKNPVSSNLFIETKEHGIKELAQADTNSGTLERTRGVLAFIFNDCPITRELVNSKAFSYTKIDDLTSKYNDCGNFEEEYKLTEGQIQNLAFEEQKSTLNLEVGAGYFFEDINGGVGGQSFNSNLNGLSLFVAGNFSPSYLNAYRNTFFFDITATYQVNTSDNIVEKSAFRLLFGPRVVFYKTRKINPYARFTVGLSVDRYTLDLSGLPGLDSFPNVLEDSDTSLNAGIEIGATIYKNIRLGILYVPEYNSQIVSDTDNFGVRLENNSFNLKLSYVFGRK